MFSFPTQFPSHRSARSVRGLTKLWLIMMIACYWVTPAVAEEAVEQLPDVVVSASRVPLPAKEIGSAVTVITGKELEQRQVRVVSDVLRDVPGVAVNRTGPVGAFTQIRIRGAEGNHTLVLIDGIEVNNPAGGSEFNFANVLNAEIARIEVLRGPQSALYGSDSIGGVINIVTKRPEPGLIVNGRGEAGSFATRDGLLNLSYGSERFYLSGFIDRFATNGVSVADEDNGNSEADAYDNTMARLKAGIKPIEFLEIDVIGMLVDSNREDDALAPVINIVDSDDESETLQRYGLAKAKLTLFDGAWEHIARASHIDDDTDFFDGPGAKTFVSNGEKTKFDYQTNVFLSTPEIAEAEHTLIFAAEREREEQFTDSAFAGPNTVSIVNYGYVGEYRVGLWDRLFLSGSVRYDDNDELFDNEITYRGTAAYLHEETGTRLHGSVGRGVKNPTLFELFGATPEFTGNPNLTTEESFGWDAGIEQSFFDGRLVVDATYFDNRIKNLIQGSGNIAVNLPGTSRIRGVEISATTEPLPGLRLGAAYTFTNGQDANDTELILRARHIASFNANYAFDLLDRRASVNLAVRYNGEQNDNVFDSFFPVQIRTVTLESFTLVNLSASYEVNDGVELFVRGENLLDDDYQEVFGFGTPGISGFAGIRIKLGPFTNGSD